jgi:pimeloyl-ACP methyl ester carboxylesterase
VQTLIFSLILYMSIQDIFVPPSRISTNDLSQRFHLPSAISKYEKMALVDQSGAAKNIGVHYLKYSGKRHTIPGLFGAVYVHHGFGASSLSWLPALPSLVDRLGARCGLGHDMVGFGFTDRQNELEWYTTEASARISQSILDKETYVDGKPLQSVALLGHSLGAISVLKMALKLPVRLSKVIILSSPALGLTGNLPPVPDADAISSPRPRLKKIISALVKRILIFPIGGYVLRRLVG